MSGVCGAALIAIRASKKFVSKYFNLPLHPLTEEEKKAFDDWKRHPGKKVFEACVRAVIAEKVSELIAPALDGARSERHLTLGNNMLLEAADLSKALETLEEFSNKDKLFKL